VITNILQI